MALWKESQDSRVQQNANPGNALPNASQGAGDTAAVQGTRVRRTIKSVEDMQNAVLSTLKSKRGILDGRDLYRVYRESDQPNLKAAIQELQKQNLVSVKGDLEAPLGVFQSVLVER